MTQTLQGFYQASGPVGKLTHIVGSSAPNATEVVTFNGEEIATNPFVGPGSPGSDRGWDNPTFAVTVPAGDVFFSQEFTTTVDHGNISPYDCLAHAAIIFSTPVQDTDEDGLLDIWETANTLTDPYGVPLPDLVGMGTMDNPVGPFHKDLFVEIGYMFTDPTTAGFPNGLTYGGVEKPHHTHLPTPAALLKVGDAFFDAPVPINVHFDVGTSVTTSGTPYQTSEASDYIIPVAFARGGEFLDETATVCFRSPGGPGDPPDPPPDPPFVCQFSEYPGTVGWKSGFRALKDALLLDPEPEVPPEDDHVCDTSGAPPGNDGPDGICERVFDRNRKDMFRYVFFAHSLGVPKAHCLDLVEFDEFGAPNPNFGLPDLDCQLGDPDFHVPNTYTGVGDFGGGDAMVTMGGFLNAAGLPVGTDNQQAGTIMHELGHTMMLRHGGLPGNPNCSPNYLSIMNYLFQLRLLKDVLGNAAVDYSGQKIGDLDEGSLLEIQGLAGLLGSVPPGAPPYGTAWYAPFANVGIGTQATRHCNGTDLSPEEEADRVLFNGMVRVEGTDVGLGIDWDADGNSLGNPAQDINFDGVNNDGFPGDNLDPPRPLLAGFNDWANLRLNQVGSRRNIGVWFFADGFAYVGPASLDLGRWDFGRFDFGRFDFGRWDFGQPDLGRSDFGRWDFGRWDFGRFDFGRWDFGDLNNGDLNQGDLGRFDFGRFDFGRWDFGRFDFGRFDFGVGAGDLGRGADGKGGFGRFDFGRFDFGGGGEGGDNAEITFGHAVAAGLIDPSMPAMTVVKTSGTTSLSAPGTVTYDYLVTNTGDVTLTGLLLSDDNVNAAPVCVATTLTVAPDAGATTTCTATHTFTQAELNANGSPTAASGVLANNVVASSNEVPAAIDNLSIPITQAASLSILKTASPTTYDTDGETISYSYLVTNDGNVSLTGPVTIADTVATDELCPAVSTVGNFDAELDPGESITCAASHTITLADLNAGSVTNVADATADGTTSPTDTETVTAVPDPSLSIVKTASPTTYDTDGETISYSYLVTNDGNVSLTGPVTIADTIATDELCPAVSTVGNFDAELDPGESITCAASHTITLADLNAGSVTNVADATADGTTSPTDTETVTAVPDPSLSIVKTASPTTYDTDGETISYSYLVTNDGNVSLTGPVTIADTIATDELCPAVSTVGNFDAELDPGESITCAASHTITLADLNAGSVTNVADATADGTTSPTDTETVTAVPDPSLSIVKTASPTTYDTDGETISYSYLVTNDGNVSLTGPVTIADTIATDELCPAVSTVGNFDAELDPGESITCAASHTITLADLNAGSVTNVADATADGTTSPTDTETVTAVPDPSLSIVKTASPTTYDTDGETISYSYLVTNDGNVSLTGPVTIADTVATDELCPAVSTVGNFDAELDPGESITCAASHTITLADLNAGSVTNVADATADGTTSPTDTETVTAVPDPSLSIVKTASPTTYDTDGETISYSYLVTNDGNVSLTGPVTIADTIATDELCPAVSTVGNFDAELDPGESITCAASHTITLADLNAGSVTNVADATADGTTSPTATVTVTDTILPTIAGLSADPPNLWPPNGNLILVTVSGFVSDNSGLSNLTVKFVVFDDPDYVDPPDAPGVPPTPIDSDNDVAIAADGFFSFPTVLEASRFGNDKEGREYKIVVTVVDGNLNEVAESTLPLNVHDQSSEPRTYTYNYRDSVAAGVASSTSLSSVSG